MITTINSFRGVTAFLNGEKGLHEFDQKLFENFEKEGHVVVMIDNLFNDSKPLSNLRHYTNLVVYTTGLRPDKVRPLLSIFEKSGVVPENVIFLSEETALTFVGTARDLAKKGTKFWFADIGDLKTLYSIEWI